MTTNVYPTPIQKEMKPLLKAAKVVKPTKLHKALQERLRELADKPICPQSLYDIQKFAQTAHQMLSNLTPIAAFDCSYMPQGPMTPFGISQAVNPVSMSIGPSMTSSPTSETYGATLIKELMAALPQFQKKPLSIDETLKNIEALKKAKKHKLARKLEEQLESELAALPKVL